MQISEQKCSQIGAPSISARTARKDSGFTFKSRLIFWAKILVAFLTLSFLIAAVKVEILINVFKTANWGYLGIAFLIIIPNILVQVWKWLYILKLANPSVSFMTALKSLLVGYPLGFVTPGRLGEIGRALYVKEISQGKTLRLFILDKLTNLVITLLFGSFGILILLQTQLTPAVKTTIWVTLALILGTLLYSIFFTSTVNLIGRLTKINHFTRMNQLVLLAFSILFYFIFFAQYLLLVLNFDRINIFPAFEAAASVFLTKTLLPISFSDLGIREGAAVYFFGKVGVNAAAALNASLLLFLLNIAVPAIAGLPILLKTKRRL